MANPASEVETAGALAATEASDAAAFAGAVTWSAVPAANDTTTPSSNFPTPVGLTMTMTHTNRLKS
jgi:hypothetical protein